MSSARYLVSSRKEFLPAATLIIKNEKMTFSTGLLKIALIFLVPGCITLNNVSSENMESNLPWLKYWTVIAFALVLDFSLENRLDGVYFTISKILVVLWCLAPVSWNGSDMIFSHIMLFNIFYQIWQAWLNIYWQCSLVFPLICILYHLMYWSNLCLILLHMFVWYSWMLDIMQSISLKITVLIF